MYTDKEASLRLFLLDWLCVLIYQTFKNGLFVIKEIGFPVLEYLYDVSMYTFSISSFLPCANFFSRQTYQSLGMEACTAINIAQAKGGNEAVVEAFTL